MRGGKAPPSPHLDAEAFHLRVTCRWDTPLVTTAHVRLLGPVGFVTADGRLVDLPSATQRRLLAILALAAGTTLRPDHLAEALGTSAGGLRTALSRVRARVGEEIIRTGAVG